MGYFFTPEVETAVPGKSCASPKTHVPLSRLSNLGHRYYSPEVGRWLSRDPIGERGGANLYVHTANSSVNLVDLLGQVVFGPSFHMSVTDQGEFGRSRMSFAYTYDCCRCTRVIFKQRVQTTSVIRFLGFPITTDTPWHWDGPQPYSEGYEDLPGCAAGKGWSRAEVDDRPGYSENAAFKIASLTQEFDTSAWCAEGPDAGRIYATVTWGHYYAREPAYVVSMWHTP